MGKKTNKVIKREPKNQVVQMTIFTEQIQKENRYFKLYDKFHIRPTSINTVTDKVHSKEV